MSFHPENFTFAGRLIILIAVVITIGGTAALWFWGDEFLPPGRYPIALLAIPALCVAGLFIALSMALLKLLGLEFFRQSPEEE